MNQREFYMERNSARAFLIAQERVEANKNDASQETAFRFLPPTPIRHYKSWFILKLPLLSEEATLKCLGKLDAGAIPQKGTFALFCIMIERFFLLHNQKVGNNEFFAN